MDEAVDFEGTVEVGVDVVAGADAFGHASEDLSDVAAGAFGDFRGNPGEVVGDGEFLQFAIVLAGAEEAGLDDLG